MAGDAQADGRIKHLELIQAVISRLGNNSFLVKGWALTVIAGFLALLATRQTWALPAVGLIPLLAFWQLDANFLRQERLYRHLYEAVRARSDTVPELSMDVSAISGGAGWWDAALSSTLLNFYGALAVVDVLVLVVCLTI